jgi:hypothetical protein
MSLAISDRLDILDVLARADNAASRRDRDNAILTKEPDPSVQATAGTGDRRGLSCSLDYGVAPVSSCIGPDLRSFRSNDQVG